MNRRTAALVGIAVIATVVAAVVAVYGLPSPHDGTADAAEPPRFVYEGERLTLEPAPGQTIRGETDPEAGTALSVRLRSSGEFLKSATATVDDDGTFQATFDLSGVPGGATFEAVVTRNGTRVVDTTGEVVE